MSELPVATTVGDEDYTIIVQDGINKRANREIFKQKDYNNLNNRPYINSTYSSSLVPVNELMQGTIQFHRISKTGKYGDLLDLPFIPTALTHLTNDGYFVQDQYYVHTDNNLTSGLLDKINTAIQSIKINDNLLTPNSNQEINITIPTKISDLTNDGYFVQDENYVHTDNNFNTDMKNSYDNLVINVNQPVSSTNKIVTMNDIATINNAYWIPIEIYKDIIFDGVINIGEEIPTNGIYAVIEGENNLVINKYTDGISDNSNVAINEGDFVFVNGNNTEVIYYIKENTWEKLSTDLSNYYNKEQSDNKYVQKENGKELITSSEKTKLAGISINANKVEKSNTNGNIKIDGIETVVYSLTKAQVIEALGYTPVEATVDLSGYYDKQQTDNKFVQKEIGKSLISDTKITKLDGISEGANKVQKSTTNGNILIDGIETTIYTKSALTKSEVVTALGYTPPSTDTNTTYDVVTASANGLMSSDMLTKLNGITESADSVSFSRNLTSGTKIGAINVNGTNTDIYAPTNTDTHYTSHLYVGTSSGKTNDATTNGNTYLMVLDNTTVRDRRLIKGTGGTTVTSDSNGNITINSASSEGLNRIEASFITNWYNYADGTNLTEAEGLTSDIYDKMDVGTILEYTSQYSYNAYYSSLIIFKNSYYTYKPQGGRYYVRNYIAVNSNGDLTTYTFSADYLSGDDTIYKGANLGNSSSSGGGLACFTGETLVSTEKGLQAIKDLKLNDKVYSKNKENQIELKEIDKLFSHITNTIYKINTGSNIISSSWSHPFYVYGKGKVLAKDLKAGDKLQDIENNIILIESIEVLSNSMPVFEIRVKDNANYFVGNDKIFVGCETI